MRTVYDHTAHVRHVSTGISRDGYPIIRCGIDLGASYPRNWCSHDEEDEGAVVGEWCPGRLRHRTLPECPACHAAP